TAISRTLTRLGHPPGAHPGDCGYLRQSRVLSCASCRAAWRSQRRGLARAAAVPPARAARVTTVAGAGTPSGAGPSPGSPLLTWPATRATGTPADLAAAITVPHTFPVSEVSSNRPSPVRTPPPPVVPGRGPGRGGARRGARPRSRPPGARVRPPGGGEPVAGPPGGAGAGAGGAPAEQPGEPGQPRLQPGDLRAVGAFLRP